MGEAAAKVELMSWDDTAEAYLELCSGNWPAVTESGGMNLSPLTSTWSHHVPRRLRALLGDHGVSLRRDFAPPETLRLLGIVHRSRWPHVLVPWRLRLPLPFMGWGFRPCWRLPVWP